MGASRAEISKGYLDELDRFAVLVRSLDDAEWAKPTRCEGWTSADVAAHVSGTLADILAGRFEGLGSPEVTDREVAERRGRTQAELADEIAEVRSGASTLLDAFDDEAWNGPAPGGIPGTVGDGIDALWFDTYIHGEDIRAAVGRSAEPGPGIAPSVRHVADVLGQREWGPATLELSGFDPIEIGGPGGTTVRGDPLEFVLVATGRAAPARFGLDESVNIYAPS